MSGWLAHSPKVVGGGGEWSPGRPLPDTVGDGAPEEWVVGVAEVVGKLNAGGDIC